jgi:regulator of sigma E protease
MNDVVSLLAGGATTFVGFLGVLTVIVFIHEMGHFLVARWCGVTVKTFSIGFGKELYGWDDRHGTHWRIAAVPLGGYVKFIDDANAASAGQVDGATALSPEERKGAFQFKPLWQRSAVIAAGPIANFILAVFLYSMVFGTYGLRMAPPVIDSVVPGKPADVAGLRPGDRILEIDGTGIETFDDAVNYVAANHDQPLTILVERDRKPVSVSVKPEVEDVKNDLNLPMKLGDIGIRRYQEARIGSLADNMPAVKAGLQVGDLIKSFDGQPVDGFDSLSKKIVVSAGREVTLVVDRKGETVTIALTPATASAPDGKGGTKQVGRIGIGSVLLPPQAVGPLSAMRLGIKETWTNSVQTLSGLGQIFTGRQSASQIGGPILMAEVTGKAIESGLESLLKLTAYFSVTIGLLNLMPIPVLDGGHLVFNAIEAVRRRPLPVAVQDMAFRVGFALLLTLIVFANYNDLVRKAKGLFPGVG